VTPLTGRRPGRVGEAVDTPRGVDPALTGGDEPPAEGSALPPGADALLAPSGPGSKGSGSASFEPSASVTRRQIRGSGLLLAGRALSSGLKFGAELLIVRYLTTSQYGAWTYALAAVVFLRGLSALGLSRAISRYLPLHLERREISDFYGVLVFVCGSVVLAGAVVIATFYVFPEQIAALSGIAADQPLDLLFILIFLVPLETLDNALTGVCAAFGDSRTIFVRRSILHPGLRVGIAATLVLMGADVMFLAYGYLLAGVIGVAYYAWGVVGAMRRRGILRLDLLRGIRLPVRRVLAYTTPVMAADSCTIFMATAGPLLLGYFSEMSTVALYQVVVPVAAMNTIVQQSFVMLFEPAASRMLARRDPGGLRELYWRSAVWVAVLTFPLFALSFTVAEPLTVLLFGSRYAAAAPILSLLATGNFVAAMAGFNGATLRVSGHIRPLIAANIIGAVTTVGVSILLIRSMGALGAGVGTALGAVVFAVLKQVALQASTGVPAVARGYRGPYATIAVTTVVLLAARILWPDNPWILVPAAALGSLVVFASARVNLSVSHTFPEVAGSRLLRAILG
jgi:O-antigen/teichoic acid export membrane protein